METIKNYLENMFMNLPKTVEINRAKAELWNMMEDKYNELKAEGKTENEAIGIVISEFGNLDELAEELGIKDCVENAGRAGNKRTVSLEEAKEYLEQMKKASLKIAIGVMLCICSPIVLVVMSGMQGIGTDDIEIDGFTEGVGLVVLLCMVAIAVAIFIYNGIALSKYEFMKKESFQLEYSTDTYIRELCNRSKSSFALKITLGVVLCIMSIIPVVMTGIMYRDNAYYESVSVSILLVMVAIAVFFFITAGMESGAYKTILQEGEYAPKEKENTLVGTIGSIYWPIVVCIYLIWGFVKQDWGNSWIIWPVAGVLFGAVASICKSVGKKN